MSHLTRLGANCCKIHRDLKTIRSEDHVDMKLAHHLCQPVILCPIIYQSTIINSNPLSIIQNIHQ